MVLFDPFRVGSFSRSFLGFHSLRSFHLDFNVGRLWRHKVVARVQKEARWAADT
jgi:hypothetical protein